LLIVGNLSYLRAQVTERHLLHGILSDIVQRDGIVDAREVLPDAVTPDSPAAVDPSVLQRFDGETFLAGVTTDMREARSSIVIGTPTLGERAAHVFGTVLKPVSQRGVRIEVITTEVRSELEREEHDAAARILQGGSIAVSNAPSGVQSAVVVDGEIVWVGNTAPLRCVDAQGVCMARTVSGVGGASLLKELQRDVVPLHLDVQRVANV
jgi:hypothetical protein